MIKLTRTTPEDLESLFIFQADPEGVQMAAFTAKDPSDKEFYMNKWLKIAANPDTNMHTMRFKNQIVGSYIHFDFMEETNVSYWIDRPFWGKGLATEGLRIYLKLTQKRPLYGRVAFDNIGSQRVLEKCGFREIARDKGYANGRQKEIEEWIYRLD